MKIVGAENGGDYGAFEMNWDNGDVRFHLTIPMSAILADRNHIPALMAFPSRMLDRYSKGFAEILMNLKTLEDAIMRRSPWAAGRCFPDAGKSERMEYGI